MLRFLYLTDTHFGAEPGAGWMLQPRCPTEMLEPLLDDLAQWLATSGVDFVLHGGDVIESGQTDQIELAGRLLGRLGRPVHVCLGNHDLFEPQSIGLWRAAKGLFPGGRVSYTLERPEVMLVVIAHHWNAADPPHHWAPSSPQVPVVDDQQMSLLTEALVQADTSGRSAILVLHSPVVLLPHEGTRPDPLAQPHNAQLLDKLIALADRHPSLRLMLAGHSHVNRIVRVGQLTIAATAAFGESPFEARLVEVHDDGRISIETLCFANLLGLNPPYDDQRRFTQGEPGDRCCVLSAMRPDPTTEVAGRPVRREG